MGSVPGLKPVTWMGDSLIRLRRFPEAVRADVGYQLELVQSGEAPTDFRPMPDAGPGTLEVRVHAGEEYRVFYVARFQDTVYVLHCFQKKTQRTRKTDLDVGRQRYRTMMERRKHEGHER